MDHRHPRHDPDGDFPDIADHSAAYEVDGTEKAVLIAALLCSDEEHAVAESAAGGANELVFFQCQREWLLTEDVFSGDECFDGNFDVPVVRRDDADDVDIGTFQDFSVVTIHIGLTVPDVRV